MAALAEAFVRVRADTKGVRDDVRDEFGRAGRDAGDEFGRGFTRDASGRLRDERGRFVSEGRRLGDGAGEGFRDGFGRSLDGIGDLFKRIFDGLLPRLSSLAGGFGPVTSAVGGLTASLGKLAVASGAFATLAAGAASATSSVLALTAALAPAAGALAALPGAAAGAVAVMGTLKLAFYGVSDAMKAAYEGDAEKFDKAFAKLTPTAQAFATEFRELVPAMKEFQQAAQTGFFSELNGSLAHFLDLLRGTQPWIQGLATNLGAVTREFLVFATAEKSISQFNTILSNTSRAVTAIRLAMQPVLTGFLDLAVVGSNFLASFNTGVTDSLTKFGMWLSEISRTGKAMQWMNDAVVVLRQLGALLADVGRIIRGVFKAAETAGGGVLGVLGQLADAAAKWVNSVEGQDVLVKIFQALGEIGKALIPVLKAAAGAVATLAPAVADLAKAFGPVLTAAIQALAPALAALAPGIVAIINGIRSAVEAVGPALLPFGQAIGQALASLQPLFAAIGPAIAALLPGVSAFFAAFTSGLAKLAPALAPIGAAIGGILTALSPLLPVIGQLAALIATSLAAGVQAILPSLQLLVQSFGQALLALSPIIPMVVQLATSLINSLVPAIAPLLPQIAQLITQFVSGLMPALAPLIPIIGQLAGILGQIFVQVLKAVVDVLIQVMPPLSQTAQIIGQALVKALEQLAPYLPQIVSALLSWIPALVELLPPITDLAMSLLPRFLDAVVQIAPLLPDLIRAGIEMTQAWLPLVPLFADLLKQLAPHIPLFIELAAVIIKDLLPPITRIAIVVAEMVRTVVDKFTELYNTLIGHSIIPDIINGIKRWFGELPEMISRFVGQAKDWAIQRFNELLSWIAGIPGRISSALSNMGGLLVGAGQQLVQGFYNGIISWWNWLVSNVQSLFGGLVDWAKSVLGIASPSKVFAAIGKELPRGLVVGIKAEEPLVRSAAQHMAAVATEAGMVAPSMTTSYEAAFAGAGAMASGSAGGRSVVIESLTIPVQGVIDPNDPLAWRRFGQQIRDTLIDLEKEA